MLEVQALTNKILEVRRTVQSGRSVLVAITGIDGAGKGYIAAQLDKTLRANGVRTAVVNIDGWLNLPGRRFDPSNPAEHFYLHAIRFDEMFAQLPEHRSVGSPLPTFLEKDGERRAAFARTYWR